MKLKGKNAVITGGTKGIGESIAKVYAKEGANLVLLGRDVQRGSLLSKELSDLYNVSVDFYEIDFNDSDKLKTILDIIINKYPQIDVLVNNAGMIFSGDVEDTIESDWDKIFAVNVKAPYLISKKIIPTMRGNGGGSIINVGSTAGLVGASHLHAYSATKGAIIELSKSMAARYAEDDIRVNVLCPGATKTDMMDKVDKEFLKMIPMQRMGDPIEIANGALFLASDDSSFITGSVLVIDGGFTAV